jgi:hypothetical protein
MMKKMDGALGYETVEFRVQPERFQTVVLLSGPPTGPWSGTNTARYLLLLGSVPHNIQ